MSDPIRLYQGDWTTPEGAAADLMIAAFKVLKSGGSEFYIQPVDGADEDAKLTSDCENYIIAWE